MVADGLTAPNVRAAIAEAAFDLFAEWGFDQVTVTDVVAAAGVTTEVFHEYYPSLADIVYEGFDDEYHAFESALANEALGSLTDRYLAAGRTLVLGRLGRLEHSLRRYEVIRDSYQLGGHDLRNRARYKAAMAHAALGTVGISPERRLRAAALAGAVFDLTQELQELVMDGEDPLDMLAVAEALVVELTEAFEAADRRSTGPA